MVWPHDRMRVLTRAASKQYRDARRHLQRLTKRFQQDSGLSMSQTVHFVVGMGVGVGAGLLLAPVSGEDTRTVIGGKIRKSGKRLWKVVLT